MKHFFYIISFIFLSFFLSSCKNIKSLYDEDIIDNDKICIFTNIENNFTRSFLSKLKENPHIGDFPQCEYLLFLIIYDKTLPIINMVGLNQGKIIDMNVYYILYKNDQLKIDKVKEIFDNPSMRTYKQYIERYDFYMSGGTMTNENTYVNYNNEGLRSYYNDMIKRISNVLDEVNSTNIQEQMSMSINPLLPFSTTQERQSYEIQMSEIIAERVIQNVVLDIVEYKHKMEENEKQCKKLYDEIMSKIDNNALRDDEIEDIINEEKDKYNKQCKKVWAKYQLEFNFKNKNLDKNDDKKEEKK